MIRAWLIVAVMALACTACGSPSDGSGDATPADANSSEQAAAADGGDNMQLSNTQWRLVSLGGEPVDMPGGSGMAPRIHFLPNGDVSGFGGCNRFGGTYSLEGGLSFGPIASTKMGCPQIGNVEQRFFTAISDTAGHRIVDGELVLLDGGGEALAAFAPATADEK